MSAWGMVGEMRLPRGGPKHATSRDPYRLRWQSEDGALAVESWDPRGGASRVGWHFDDVHGWLVVADAALYGRDRLRTQLGARVDDGWTNAALLALAYQRWGEDMLCHLDGDYAFVVCDLRRWRVFAATDPAGVRPLFYRCLPGRSFAFSSNAEALAAWCGLDARIPESRLLEPMFYSEHLAHLSHEIEGVERLMAAHSCRVDAGGMRVSRYWTPGAVRPAIAADDVGGWVEALREHLDNAVRKRLEGDVRVGVMFSGGMDSSTVLALAERAMGSDCLFSYSVVNRGNPDCPETRAIDAVLEHLQVHQTCVDVGNMRDRGAQARTLAAQAPRFVLGRAGFSLLFSQMANTADVGVMMNGLDGDDMFHYFDLLTRQIRNGQFSLALRNARKQDRLNGIAWMEPKLRRQRLVDRVPWALRDVSSRVRGGFTAKSRLRAMMLSDVAIRQFKLRERFNEGMWSARIANTRRDAVPTNMLASPVVLDAIERIESTCRHSGVEMRCPLLDQTLMDFTSWIPLELRLRNGHLKWILRKAMNPYLPHGVVWRGDKVHIGAYFDRVMLQPVLEQAVSDFRGSGPAIAPYIDRSRFMQEAERWQSGAIEAVWKLGLPLLLENWLRHNSDKVRFGH